MGSDLLVSPYQIGESVLDERFFGRTALVGRLRDLLTCEPQKPVLLCGARRVGKSSILLNLDKLVGSSLKIINVNLLKARLVRNLPEFVMVITDEIAKGMSIPPPDDSEIERSPVNSLRDFCQQAAQEQRFVLALDEYEVLNGLIREGKVPKSLPESLMHCTDLIPGFSIIFSGLNEFHELEADTFMGFGNIETIRVGLLSEAESKALLRQPDGERELKYSEEASSKVWQLTSGQPYLIQLLGFLLVRRYNDGLVKGPGFSESDIDELVASDQWESAIRNYFELDWGQTSGGEKLVLAKLASAPKGLSIAEIGASLAPEAVNAALERLSRRGTIQSNSKGFEFSVELFRQFVLSQKKL